VNILIASTAALLVLTAGSGAAFAGTTETASVTLRTAKLDLSNPQDARALKSRINAAAMEACGAYPGSLRELKRVVARSACHRDAVAGAVAQLSSSQASLVRIDNRNH
jgi:UrcA family protein